MSSDDKRKALNVDTPVYYRELHSGAWTGAPVAELGRLSYGTHTGVEQDIEAFLAEYLKQARANIVAQYCLPEDVSMHIVRVAVRREDLPAGIDKSMELDVPCILSPNKKDTWVIVPVIDHTFYVPRGTDLDEAIRSEVARIVAAKEMAGDEFTSLFPARDHELVRASVEVHPAGDSIEGRARSLRKRRIEEHKRKTAVELLESVSTKFVDIQATAELVGRDRGLRTLKSLMAGERVGVLLVGNEAVGKSALFRAWRLESKTRTVYSTSAAQLIAGMSGMGEWQDRMVKVMEAAELVDATLYFENFAELFGSRPERGGTDIPGVMRRYLVEGRVRVVGEMTPESVSSVEARNAGLFSSMSRVMLEPLTAEQTRDALALHVAWWNKRQPNRPKVSPDVVDAVVELAERYLPYRAFPGKAVRAVDELRATREQQRDPSGERPLITVDHAYQSFSLATGIPAFLLREDQALRRTSIVDAFRERIVGQDEAVGKVVDNICVVKARLQPTGKPLSTLLFVGPTGVGKTEVARTLSTFLFGSEQRMVRFDMSEYMDAGAAERLIRGTERDDGLLTSKVREQPFCVLLLDEIEKAHPNVFDLLLQVCGEGRLTDARGKTAYFHNAIIIMTSNLGASQKRAPIGIGAKQVADRDHYASAARKTFRPEFINRIDSIVAFRQLTRDEAREVARIALGRISDRRGVQESGMAVEVSDGALEVVAERGYSKDYGGRALRRYIDDFLIGPLARLLARLSSEVKGAIAVVKAVDEPEGFGDFSAKSRITVLEAGALKFEVYRRPGAAGRKALRGMAGLSQMRRDVDYWLTLDRSEWVKEQTSFLRSQLATARAPKKKGKQDRQEHASSAEIVRLQREQHRLGQLWDKAAALQVDMHTAEELGLGALFDGQLLDDWVDDATVTYNQFREQLFYLLMAQESRRDAVTLALFDVQSAGVFEHWLAPLLPELERRSWKAQFHVRERKPGWPESRGWGPPHDAAWLKKNVLGTRGKNPDVLMRVSGAYAGCVLGLEAGVHRFVGFHQKIDPAHLVITRMTMWADLSDKEWLDPDLTSRPTVPSAKSAADRVREKGRDVIKLRGKGQEIQLAKADYWRHIERVAAAQVLAAIAQGQDEELLPSHISRNP